MADENEIRISITLDDGSVKEGFARIQKSGEDSSKRLADSFDRAKSQLLHLVAAYVSFEAGKHFIEESIRAASQYESALNSMNKALSSAGTWTREASISFVELAESIELTTTFSASQALALEGLARNYARSNEQAKALTKASIELSAVTGQSATQALQQLGGTLDGTSGRLGKVIPQVKSLTEFQLRSGEAIAIVAARFKDAAAGDVNTWEGSIKRLANAFDNLQTAFGKMITSSPTIRAVIKFVTDEFGKFAKMVSSISGNDNFLKQLTNDALNFASAFNGTVVRSVETFYNVARISFNGVRELFQGLITVFANVAAKVVGFFKPGSELANNLQTFANSAGEVFDQFQAKTTDSLNKIGSSNWTQGIESKIVSLQTAVNNAKPFEQMRKDMKDVADESLGLSGEITGVGQAWNLWTTGAMNSMRMLRADSIKSMQDIGAAATRSLAGGVANAMASVGKTLIKGGDLFKAFAGAMLAAFGQALIQLGTGYIALGLARVLTSYGADATGWGLIGQGSAMAVLGGAMAALGGGDTSTAGAGGGGGGGGGGGVTGGGAIGNPATAIEKETQRVQVNIHGSVFDTQETGLRLVDIINDAFNTQGATVQVR